jgi:hypothetical protein
MPTQAASITLPVSNTLLEFSRGKAVGGSDAIDFYVFNAQELFTGWLSGRSDFASPNVAVDFGLLGSGDIELSGNNYARVALSFGASGWSVDNDVVPILLSNLGVISFPVASADWSQALKLAVFDHTSGDLLDSGLLDSSVTVTAGNDLSFAASALRIVVPT